MLASIVLVHANPAGDFRGFKRLISSLLVLGFCGLCLPVQTMAQRAPAQGEGLTKCVPRAPTSGINTSRLSGKALERWCSIERLIYATDKAGNYLHPTLQYLMEWAETSGDEIYIEFPEVDSIGNTAGNFHIERFDPAGVKHTAVIRLYLLTIDRAYVGPVNMRSNGLIPFAGLCRDECYAEVLGHELAHAIDILSSLERARMVEELVQQTNEQFYSFRALNRGWPLAPRLSRLLAERDALLEELEKTADAYEEVIWHELRKDQRQEVRALSQK
jgi:hypothetical protein